MKLHNKLNYANLKTKTSPESKSNENSSRNGYTHETSRLSE